MLDLILIDLSISLNETLPQTFVLIANLDDVRCSRANVRELFADLTAFRARLLKIGLRREHLLRLELAVPVAEDGQVPVQGSRAREKRLEPIPRLVPVGNDGIPRRVERHHRHREGARRLVVGGDLEDGGGIGAVPLDEQVQEEVVVRARVEAGPVVEGLPPELRVILLDRESGFKMS